MVGMCGDTPLMLWWAMVWRCRFDLANDVNAYPLVEDLCCCHVHWHILVVPFTSFREVAVYVLAQICLLLVVRGPLDGLLLRDGARAVVFQGVRGGFGVGLRCFAITR